MEHKALASVVVCLFAAMLFAPPIAQDPAYHVMADQHTIFGVPNALNVVSNVAFLYAGIIGIVEIRRRLGARWTQWPYLVFFGATIVTAFGSTWYHLAPNNDTVVWDRLPIAIACAGLLTAVLAERVSERIARDAFAPLVIAAALSVFYWYATELGGHGDLRPYAAVQFGSLAVIVAALLLYKSREPGDEYLWTGLVLYGAAKFFEVADGPIYWALGIVSGHTLKHLAAAAAVACVVAMLRQRAASPSEDAQQHTSPRQRENDRKGQAVSRLA